jgi:hypothetical protein
MDKIVLRGMAKWPNVPAVYGWLALDRRGQWLIKGGRITNRSVVAFIGRNYTHDEHGRWFFQNGPQRVFVALEYAPLVYRTTNPEHSSLELETHTGKPASTLRGAFIDENGVVLLETEHGVGNLHDNDLDRLLSSFVDAGNCSIDEDALDELLELLTSGQSPAVWLQYRGHATPVQPIRSSTVPGRFGFIADPVAPAGPPERR